MPLIVGVPPDETRGLEGLANEEETCNGASLFVSTAAWNLLIRSEALPGLLSSGKGTVGESEETSASVDSQVERPRGVVLERDSKGGLTVDLRILWRCAPSFYDLVKKGRVNGFNLSHFQVESHRLELFVYLSLIQLTSRLRCQLFDYQ